VLFTWIKFSSRALFSRFVHFVCHEHNKTSTLLPAPFLRLLHLRDLSLSAYFISCKFTVFLTTFLFAPPPSALFLLKVRNFESASKKPEKRLLFFHLFINCYEVWLPFFNGCREIRCTLRFLSSLYTYIPSLFACCYS